jgi:hypothetical protein
MLDVVGLAWCSDEAVMTLKRCGKRCAHFDLRGTPGTLVLDVDRTTLSLPHAKYMSTRTLPNVTDPVRGFNRQALIGTPIEAQERADEPWQIRI